MNALFWDVNPCLATVHHVGCARTAAACRLPSAHGAGTEKKRLAASGLPAGSVNRCSSALILTKMAFYGLLTSQKEYVCLELYAQILKNRFDTVLSWSGRFIYWKRYSFENNRWRNETMEKWNPETGQYYGEAMCGAEWLPRALPWLLWATRETWHLHCMLHQGILQVHESCIQLQRSNI